MEVAFQVVAGLVLLALGGEGLIRGSVRVARRLGLSELLIGLTLVGFGTSFPELVTSIDAALRGSPGIALGNVVGSNISNVLLIFALAVLIRPIAFYPAATGRDAVLGVAVSVLLAALAIAFGELDRWLGAMLAGLLVVYMASVWRVERIGRPAVTVRVGKPHAGDPAPKALWPSAAIAFGGLGLVVFGADLLVKGAVAGARIAGISETVIGLTVVAIGTSLPELVATLAAALRGRADVAFGTIVGSNIYNILGILGVTALIHPIAMPADIGFVDWAVLVGSSMVLLVLVFTGVRAKRYEGSLLLTAYCGYIAYLLVR